MADLSIKRDTLGSDGDKGDATVGGSGTTITISNIEREDADVLNVALTGVDYSALGAGDPGEDYEYAALTVRAEGPHFHSPAGDRPTYALRVIAEDYDGDGDSNHEHYGIYVRARNAGIGGGGFPGASFGKALYVAEGDAYFADDVGIDGDFGANGDTFLGSGPSNHHQLLGTINLNASPGVDGQVAIISGGLPAWGAAPAPSAGSVGATQLADNLDLSGNGTTTLGGFGGKVQVSTSTGTLNNFTLNDDTLILVFSSGAVSLTGLTGGWDGRLVFVTGTSSSFGFANESASSTAANRLSLPNSTTWTLTARSGTWLRYDGTASRWYLLNGTTFPVINVSGSATFGSLTSGRIPFAGTGGLLTDDSAFVWDNANKRLGIGASPSLIMEVKGSNASGVIAATNTNTSSSSGLALYDSSSTFRTHLAYGNTGSGANFAGRNFVYSNAEWTWIDQATAAKALTVVPTANGVAVDFTNGSSASTSSASTGRLIYNSSRQRFQTSENSGSFRDIAAGTLIGRQIITASGTYTPTSGTYRVRLRMVGGGGGSGGSASDGTTTMDVSGGGASGAYLEHFIDPGAAITGGSVSIGAAGSAGASTPATGGTGGDTTVVIQGVTYTAKGGLGGARGSGLTTGSVLRAGGAVQAGSGASSGTPDVVHQEAGKAGMIVGFSSTASCGGDGGSNPLGSGGQGAAGTSAQGAAGTGYGSGGGGNVSTSTNTAGRAGQPGVVIIEEYR